MRKLLIGILGVYSVSTYSNVIQYFTGISYNNPAELAQIKKHELIFGGTGFYTDARFKGSVLNFNTGTYGRGENHSRTTSLLPFGRIAKRINQKFVFGFDVTQPFHSNLVWGNNAFTRYATTHNLLTDTDFSPKLAFAFSKRLQIGGGANLNFLKNNEVNFAMPYPAGSSTYKTLTNRTSGFGVGFNIGVNFALTQMDFLGLTHYSKIKQRTKGYSRLGPLVNNNHLFTFYMPDTTILSYTHIFNPKWLTNFTAFRTRWDRNQYVRLYNLASPTRPMMAFPMLFKPSWAFLGVVRRQWNEKLAISLVGMMDRGPERDKLRTIVFPSDEQYFIAISGEYKLNKSTEIQLIYGHGYSQTNINNTVTLPGIGTIPFTTGPVNINADVLNLRLKIIG